MSCCTPAAPDPRRHRQPGHHRTVCAALFRATRQALAAEPARAPPTARSPPTTSPVHRPGTRRAEVAGQLFPSAISVLGPVDAAPQAIGMACIVFAGSVGGDHALAQVVAILNQEQQDP